ncbi:MAG: c-type cytochrome [Chloroflexi bacterium]|nr:c-type cytochrome [Chloroflexota bacterium]
MEWKMKWKWFVLVLIFPALAACDGLAGEPRIVATIPPSSADSADTASIAPDMSDSEIAAVMTLGGQIWADRCAQCHGEMGGGTADGAPLPDLSDMSDEAILIAIAEGLTSEEGKEMPAFGEELNAEQLNAAMTYAKMMSRAIRQGMINSDAASASGDSAASSIDESGAVVTSLGAISGTLRNGTEGGVIPADLPVILHIVDTEGNDQTVEGVAVADGTFRFEEVTFDVHHQYAVTTSYNDITFVSPILPVDPAEPELSLPVTLYELGAESSAIVIDGISEQIVVQEGVMEMIQIVSFVNQSDRVYYTPGADDATVGTSVSVRLPQGATLADTASNSYRVSADGMQIFDTRPLVPGQRRIMHLGYQLPYGSSAGVDQGLDYLLEGPVDVVLVNNGLTLASEALSAQEPLTFEGTSMAAYGGTVSLPAGSTLSFRVEGSPAAISSTQTTAVADQGVNPIAYVLIIVGVASLLLAAGLSVRDRMMRRRKGA